MDALSHLPLFATLWTVVPWAPVSMGFSRQEYWSGESWPPPGDLPDPGIAPMFLKSPVLAPGKSFVKSESVSYSVMSDAWRTHGL